MVDCMRDHSGSDLPGGKPVLSTRWKIWQHLSSRVELYEKFLAKRLALSVDVVRTSGPLKSGGMVDFPLLRTLLQILQKSRDPIR